MGSESRAQIKSGPLCWGIPSLGCVKGAALHQKVPQPAKSAVTRKAKRHRDLRVFSTDKDWRQLAGRARCRYRGIVAAMVAFSIIYLEWFM